MSQQPKIAVDLILKKMTERAEQVHSRAQKASDVLLGPLETDLATTPYDVVYTEDRIKLKHYKPEKVTHKYPLLLVYALINRETMLDLQPGRSVVQSFMDLGLEIYMIDWGYPTRKDQFLDINDHVNGYMNNVIDFIRKRHDIDQINLMGICMGGAFSVMYSSLHPEKIQNLVTTVTPTNFDTDAGLLHIWMKNTRADEMGSLYGNMPGDLMNLGFLLLNPARLILDKYVGFLENMDNRTFVENFVRMEKWIFDSPDVPGATFRQFIEECYKKNKLINSELELDGQRVDLKNLSMPLLNIYGKFDHLVPPQACELLTGRVGSKDTEDMVLDTGHIGIYVSSKCQKLFAPKIAGWLKEREGTPKKFGSKRKTRRSAAAKPGSAKSAAGKTAKAKTAKADSETGTGPVRKTATRRKSSAGQTKNASTADKGRK